MKFIMLLIIILTVGCILAAGCVGQIKKDNVSPNASISPTNTFSPFVNNTTSTITPVKSGLNGTLVVSISGWDADLPLLVDNQSAGIVTKSRPISLILGEGNHTVQVCSGTICEKEDVEIKFARQVSVDFSERLKRDAEFPNPTARIIDYYNNGNGVSVVVEFINPSAKDLTMTAEVSVGYSFINDRTNLREGQSTRGKAYTDVKAGQRQTYVLPLYFASGYSYMFDPPVLQQITTK